jgi:hypothetical protein
MVMLRTLAEATDTPKCTRAVAELAEPPGTGIQGVPAPAGGAGARHRQVARRGTAKGAPMDESLLISVEDLSTARDRASKSMTDNDGND